ncbi:MAG: methyltransferase domain-containing protein [Mycobacteriales bacterium]
MTIANVDMAAAWDGDEGARWAENADRYETTSAAYRSALLASAGLGPDSVVLDIGCGTGRSTREAARIAASGSALGVDLSSRMLARARERAAAEGLANVRFEQADAQVHPFEPGAFDVVISSFGWMFFADPVAALANIGLALRPAGRVALLAWRELPRNEWVVAVRTALAAGRELPTPPADAPGPFAFARRERAQDVLGRAGFVDVRFDDVAEPLTFGRDADDAFSFMSTFGMTSGLTADLDEATRTTALDALRRTVQEHETEDGVRFAGSAWLITARPSGASG